VSATWVQDTAKDNLLIAILSAISTGMTVTPPPGAGWTLADSASNGSPAVQTYIYYILKAPVHKAANPETFSLTGAVRGICLELMEFTNTNVANAALDQHNHNSGANNQPSTGITAGLATNTDLGIGAIAQGGTAIFSNPTNGYFLDSNGVVAVTQGGLSNLAVGMAGTGTAVSSDLSSPFAGAVAAFKIP
jgi:hypothetical protein